MDSHLTIRCVVGQSTPRSIRKIQMVHVTSRARLCDLDSNDVAFTSYTIISSGTSVGDNYSAVAEVSSSVFLPPIIADGNNLTSIGVGMTTRAGPALLVVNRCYAVMPRAC